MSLVKGPARCFTTFKRANTWGRRPTRRSITSTNHPKAEDAHVKSSYESLGKSFYVGITSVVAFFAFYKYTKKTPLADEINSQPFLTRVLEKYSHLQNGYRNADIAHTQAVEDVAHDRFLFEGSGASRYTQFRNPEMLNCGSRRNVATGSYVDLSAVIQHASEANAPTDEGR